MAGAGQWRGRDNDDGDNDDGDTGDDNDKGDETRPGTGTT
jgi:hypothetical protein